MSNLLDGLKFSLLAAEDFENREMATKIVDAFMSAPKRVRPKKFGFFEPKSKTDNVDDIVNILVNDRGPKSGPRSGSLILEVGKGCGFQVQWNKSARPSFSLVAGHLMFSEISKDPSIMDDFLGLVRTLVELVRPVYGEVRSMAVKGWDAPFNLLLRLPDVPPVSIYGKEYISLFGKDKIEKAPFLHAEQIGECYWLVAHCQVTEGVPDAKRDAIRAYFGEDSFMANGRWKYTNGSAPEFDLSHSLCD